MSAGPPKPPPSAPRHGPPPRLRTPPTPPIQTPPKGQPLSQASKDAITEMALGLLEEQVQARIVHYRADLQTNPELDAITAQVVAELRQLRERVGQSDRPPVSRETIAETQEKTLRMLLQRVFRQGGLSLLLEKRMKEMHRRLARLFFQSELHEKTQGQDGTTKVIQHGEQAVYYLLARYQHRLKHELGGFDYSSEDVRDRAFALLAKFSKDMQDGFLSRRSSELKRIVAVFNEMLVDFFANVLPLSMADLAHEVIYQSGSAEGKAFPYKFTQEGFPRFRAVLERQLMIRLVGFAEDQLVSRLADTAGAVRNETIKFITDPRIFSMIIGELCDGLYDFFCNEGFLDLPTDWRHTNLAPEAE